MKQRVIDPTPAEAKLLQKKAQAVMLHKQRIGEWSGSVVPHSDYQDKPVQWIVEKLGIPEHMIRWSLLPAYQDCHCGRCRALGQAGGPHVWDGDVDPLVQALEAIFQGKSVAVSSGTTTSKTYTVGACGTLCFLAAFENSNVFSIAPKRDLLLKNMWKEIGDLWPRFKRHFPDAELLTGNLRMLPGEGRQELWSATAFGAGVGAEEELAQRLKGMHRARMLWVVEETPGVDQAIMETIIKTASAEFNPIVALGNPEHQHDPLANFARRKWVTAIRISALDFPNVVCDEEIIPGGRSLVSVQRDLEDADGQEDHPHYLSQVRGIAPAQSTRALVRWEWCEAAASRFNEREYRQGPPALGADVADSPTGDFSAFSRWDGACCTEVVPFRAEDASEVGRRIYQEMNNPWSPINPRHVGIDAVGVGASTVNELKRLGVKIRTISGGTRPVPTIDMEAYWAETKRREDGTIAPAGPKMVEAERYANLRSQVYWRLREDLRLNRIALPNDHKLFEELTAMEYEEPNGKITVMPKDKLRVRLGRSPDRADAVAYGNWVRARTPVRQKKKAEALPRNDKNRDYGLEKKMARHTKMERESERRLRSMLRRRRRA